MLKNRRSFIIAAVLAFLLQVTAIFLFKIAYNGLDCGLLEQRVCSLPVFFDGVAYLVASINFYTLGLPTIILALLFGGAWRMYGELRKDGMKPTDLLGR